MPLCMLCQAFIKSLSMGFGPTWWTHYSRAQGLERGKCIGQLEVQLVKERECLSVTWKPGEIFCLPLGNQLDYHTIKSKEQETRRGSCAVGIGNMRRDE